MGARPLYEQYAGAAEVPEAEMEEWAIRFRSGNISALELVATIAWVTDQDLPTPERVEAVMQSVRKPSVEGMAA